MICKLSINGQSDKTLKREIGANNLKQKKNVNFSSIKARNP